MSYSDSDEDDANKGPVEEPMPEYEMRHTDLAEDLVKKVIRLAEKACNSKTMSLDIATLIHEGFKSDPDLNDETAGWHVIVGKSFASAITHKTENVIFFDLQGKHNVTFLIFKTE